MSTPKPQPKPDLQSWMVTKEAMDMDTMEDMSMEPMEDTEDTITPKHQILNCTHHFLFIKTKL